MATARQAQIIGWGKYLPHRVMTNDDLATMVDTSDEWIRQRTGIAERRIAGAHESTAEMGLQAAQGALQSAGVSGRDLDLVIVATATPDQVFPSMASILQDALGASHAGAFDLSAGCSGFVYALVMATAAIRSSQARMALVVGAERLSAVTDWSDRNTCVLFGDGAGAVLLGAGEGPSGILSSTLGSDGSGADALALRVKETDDPKARGPYIVMDGRQVYKFASRVIVSSVKQVVADAGVTLDDLKWLVPHQANQRIIASACEALGLPADKAVSNLDRYGNTSAASIPIALCEAAEEGKLADGDLIVLVGFGAGLSWGAALVRWGRATTPVWTRTAWVSVRQLAAFVLWRVRGFRRIIESRLRPLLRRWRKNGE
jgi:3-oxoacyl-[acyl-carrier-protein] synthase-3